MVSHALCGGTLRLPTQPPPQVYRCAASTDPGGATTYRRAYSTVSCAISAHKCWAKVRTCNSARNSSGGNSVAFGSPGRNIRVPGVIGWSTNEMQSTLLLQAGPEG